MAASARVIARNLPQRLHQDVFDNSLGLLASAPEFSAMKPRKTVAWTIDVKVHLCLWPIVALISMFIR